MRVVELSVCLGEKARGRVTETGGGEWGVGSHSRRRLLSRSSNNSSSIVTRPPESSSSSSSSAGGKGR